MKKKETPKRLAPTLDTLRVLFAKSGNQCAFTGCIHQLIDEEYSFIAQVCHIHDALPGGRFVETMSNEERRKPENLILLCYQHHIKTDNVAAFPPESLVEMKRVHEMKSEHDYIPPITSLDVIFDDLKSIKHTAEKILSQVEESEKTIIERMEKLLSVKQNVSKLGEGENVRRIDEIMELRKAKKHKTAISLLESFKEKNWGDLSGHEKYKLTANIGICYLDLNDSSNAASFLIKAHQYDSDNEKAIGLAALGYSMFDTSDEATNFIEQAVKNNGDNPNVWVSFILLRSRESSVDELIPLIPDKFRNTMEICSALGGAARSAGDIKGAISLFQQALDNSEDDRADMKALLATTILESVAPSHANTRLRNEARNKINYCIQLLDEAWNDVKETELRLDRAWWVINRGVAKKYANRSEEALDDIKLAQTILGDDFLVLKHLAIFSFESGDLVKALTILDRMIEIKPEEKNEQLVFKGELLLMDNRIDEAEEIFKELLGSEFDQKLRGITYSALVDCCLKTDRETEAIRLCDQQANESPDILMSHINRAKVLISLGNNEGALVGLDEGIKHINADSESAEKYEISMLLLSLKNSEDAIPILESISLNAEYTPATKALIRAYDMNGDTGKALEACKKIREEIGPIDMLTGMESSIYESIGDLNSAISVCKEHLEVYPDDVRVKLRLANVYARIGDAVSVENILSDLSFEDSLHHGVAINAAKLYAFIGIKSKTLELLYDVRRKNFNDYTVHSTYINMLTQLQLDHYYEPGKVEAGTAVVLSVSKSDEIRRFLILDNVKPIHKDELGLNDRFTQSLLGRETGDIVEIENELGTSLTYTIKEILSKYTYAFQESMTMLSEQFSEESGVVSFSYSENQSPDENLRPVLNGLDKRAESDKNLLEFYQNETLGIGFISEARTQSPIKTWSRVIGDKNFGVYNGGLHNEEEYQAHELITENIGIVLDIISILTFFSLNKLELLSNLSNELVIPQSTLDDVNQIIYEFEQNKDREFISIGKEDDQYIRQLVTPEHSRSIVDQYKRLKKWLEDNCNVLPCHEALKLNTKERDKLESLIGKIFFEEILLAKEKGYLLLADERVIRNLAQSEYKIKTCSSYMIINFLGKSRILTNSEDLLIELIKSNHKNIPVTAIVLASAAKSSKYEMQAPFTQTILALSSENSSEDSAIYVAVEFFKALYLENILVHKRENLIKGILKVLVKGRNERSIHSKLDYIANYKFSLLQRQRMHLDEIFKSTF